MGSRGNFSHTLSVKYDVRGLTESADIRASCLGIISEFSVGKVGNMGT